MVTVIVLVVLGVVGLAVVAWAGSRFLGQDGPTSSSNAFGGFDVFNPGHGRAKDELQSQEHQTVITPSPDEHDRPVRVNLRDNTAKIRRPRP